MNFSIAQIIARLWAPRHEISCSWLLWQRLCARLREHGRNATRESGALYRRASTYVRYAWPTLKLRIDGRYDPARVIAIVR